MLVYLPLKADDLACVLFAQLSEMGALTHRLRTMSDFIDLVLVARAPS